MRRLLICVLGLTFFGTGCTHVKMGLFMFNSNPYEHDAHSVVRGQAAFQNNCTQCHGSNADGQGELATGLSTPPTNFRAADYSKPAIRLAAHISYGKGSDMPAFIETLSYGTIWDIANYLQSLQSRG